MASFDENRRFLFNLLFGYRETKIVCHMVDKHMKLSVSVDENNKVKLMVNGFDYDYVCREVLLIDRKKDVSRLLSKAEG